MDSLLNSPSAGKAPLGLYCHVPLGRKAVPLCYFRVYTDKNSADVRPLSGPPRSNLKDMLAHRWSWRQKFAYLVLLPFITDLMKAILPWDEAEEVTLRMLIP